MAAVAAVGGLGFFGWAILIGGLAVWSRAKAVGIPAVEAVAVTPDQVLVAEGVAFAAPAFGAAIVVSIVVFAWTHGQGRSEVEEPTKRRETNSTKEAAAGPDARADTDDTDDELRDRRAQAEELRDDFYRAGAVAVVGGSLLAGCWLVGKNMDNVWSMVAVISFATVLFVVLEFFTKDPGKRADPGPLKAPAGWWRRVRGLYSQAGRRTKTALGAIILGLVALAAFWFWQPEAAHALIAGAAGAGLLLLFTGFLHSDPARPNYAYAVVSTFFGLSLVWGLMSFFASTENARVEPFAALRSEMGPVCGFFIARSENRVYVGTFPRVVSTGATEQPVRATTCVGPSQGQQDDLEEQVSRGDGEPLAERMVEVPLAELTDIAIGEDVLFGANGEKASEIAARQAVDLCERQLGRTAPPTELRGCTEDDLALLRGETDTRAGESCEAFASQAEAQQYLLALGDLDDSERDELGFNITDEGIADCPNQAPFRGNLTLQLDSGPGSREFTFRGDLTSIDPGCLAGRSVRIVLTKTGKRRPTGRIAKVDTNEKGHYSIKEVPAVRDKKFRTVAVRKSHAFRAIASKTDECVVDKSEGLPVPARDISVHRPKQVGRSP